MAHHKVEITGVNTNEIVVLTSKETEDLFKQYKNGDNKAKERLVNGNLKLVLSILKKYTSIIIDLDCDLVNNYIHYKNKEIYLIAT